MIAVERSQFIVKMLHEKDIVTVDELSREMKVTKETIRRDLEKLEHQGIIWRVHGGAHLKTERSRKDVPISMRKEMNTEAKKVLAERCLEIVEENDILMLDNSTTVLYLARELRDSALRVTVITNSLSVVNELAECETVEVILLGGVLRHGTKSFSSSVTQELYNCYHANKAFVSSSGISLKCGLSDYDEMEAVVRRKLLDGADQRYFVTDTTKVGKSMLHVIGGFDLIDYLVVDRPIDEGVRKGIEENDVSVIVCSE